MLGGSCAFGGQKPLVLGCGDPRFCTNDTEKPQPWRWLICRTGGSVVGLGLAWGRLMSHGSISAYSAWYSKALSNTVQKNSCCRNIADLLSKSQMTLMHFLGPSIILTQLRHPCTQRFPRGIFRGKCVCLPSQLASNAFAIVHQGSFGTQRNGLKTSCSSFCFHSWSGDGLQRQPWLLAASWGWIPSLAVWFPCLWWLPLLLQESECRADAFAAQLKLLDISVLLQILKTNHVLLLNSGVA